MTGQQFQKVLCKMLADNGFWAYETINKQSGQPVDIIAVRSNIGYIIECKVTQSDRFPLSRVEDNQITAIEKFSKCNNDESWFAFYFAKHPDDVLFVKANHIFKFVNDNATSVTYEELKKNACHFWSRNNHI